MWGEGGRREGYESGQKGRYRENDPRRSAQSTKNINAAGKWQPVSLPRHRVSPRAGSQPLFLSSRYSCAAVQHSQQKVATPSGQYVSGRLYFCLRRLRNPEEGGNRGEKEE